MASISNRLFVDAVDYLSIDYTNIIMPYIYYIFGAFSLPSAIGLYVIGKQELCMHG